MTEFPPSQSLSLLFAVTKVPPTPSQRAPVAVPAPFPGCDLGFTVDIVQWSMDSSEKRTLSLMNTAVPRRMKEVKKWMWMEFLVQCSFLQEREIGWA